MLAIGLRFPAGRYHATPWGRHVNEADVEWPPAPWRLLRALIATWHRKVDAVRFPEATLEALVMELSETLPVYRLPPAIHAHSRHYMPLDKPGKTTLIFDAFARVADSAELAVVWPESELADEERTLLAELLDKVGFIGRAESWVHARLIENFDNEADCIPSELSLDSESGEAREPVRLITPMSPSAYGNWLQRTRSGLDWEGMKPKARRQLEITLPEKLLDAMRLDTGDIQAAGWSRPPGARFVTYQRPYDCFRPARRVRVSRAGPASVTNARLALQGKPLPRLEDSVRIGELVRNAAIRKAQSLGPEIPPELSGHGLPSDNRHGHAHYLPEDADCDGRIDHVLIHATAGLRPSALTAIHRIEGIWKPNGGEWRVLLEGFSNGENDAQCAYLRTATKWLSITPYLRPWHVKRNFGYAAQIERECLARDLPKPDSIRFLPEVEVKGRTRRSTHFRRFRSKRGLVQPDRQGVFAELTFSNPVRGPIALGFGCHFGLGLFGPAESA